MKALLERISEVPADHFRRLKISDLDGDELLELSRVMKLSLSGEDMREIQNLFRVWNREPTDVELEVIAQTWSEHCKHRIFAATLDHDVDGEKETIDSLFKTYIHDVSKRIFENKPDFVLSAFHDNAGFIRLDDNLAICLKAETHNHPSAIEPYSGANTGLGGVIRDILGAGKGAKPIASFDVLCVGPPGTKTHHLRSNVIHPRGVMRGVVRGASDYGNRMGIPTVSGAIQFDQAYLHNPLVYFGTAGVIPIADIDKEMTSGLKIISAGAETGRDGLHGATFSSAALDAESHEEDQQAIQSGNPVEGKKLADFVITAREQGLIAFITDCGAGGYSSACGEMLKDVGGVIELDRIRLREEGMTSREIFISESQERMVLAVKEEDLPGLQQLADDFETGLTVIGESDGSGTLKVTHAGETVCELDGSKLHDAPVRQLTSSWQRKTKADSQLFKIDEPLGAVLKNVLSDLAIVSREPVIREFDYEAQGNTVLKPLAGAAGDAPQDAAVMRIDGSRKLMSMGLSLLPEWGKFDPYAMGTACVDECFRQLVASGANPDKIVLLDNFCAGNPEDPGELGALVETVKGIAKAAEVYQAPFVSGKDSFYNCYETERGTISVPVTVLISGMGVVEEAAHVTGASLRQPDSIIAIVGATGNPLGGSVLARKAGITDGKVPETDLRKNLALYHSLYDAIKCGWILSAHDISEGGLAVALAEMAFSGQGGLNINLGELPISDKLSKTSMLFNESPGRLLIEISPGDLHMVEAIFAGQAFGKIGQATPLHGDLTVEWDKEVLLSESILELKAIWKNGLVPYS